MRKTSLIFIAFLLLLIPTLSFANGEGSNILLGKTFYTGTLWNYGSSTPVSELTDGDLDSSITVTGQRYWIILDEPTFIKSLYIKSDAIGDIRFYDDKGTMIHQRWNMTTGTILLDKLVSRIDINHFELKDFYEIEAYAGDLPDQVKQVVARPISPEKIEINWELPHDPSIVNYEIHLNGGLLEVLNSDVDNYLVTGLTPNTVYHFQIISIGSHGMKSLPVSFIAQTLDIDETPPAEIRNLKSTITNDSIKFTWENPPDVDFHEVRIFRDGQQIGVAVTPANYFIDFGLTEHTTYTFVFRSIDRDGNASQGVSVTETTKGKPRGKTCLDGFAWEFSVELEWSKNNEATKYYIYQNGVKVAETSDTTTRVEGLTNSQTYMFSVSPVNEWGEGDRSNEIKLTPMEIPAPDKPLSVGYVASNRSVTLNWTPVDYAQKYNIYKEDDSGQSSFIKSILFDVAHAAGEIKIGETTETSYTINELEEGTSYTFYVSAENHKGESPRASVTARTISQPIPVDMKIDLTPWDIIQNAIVIIGSMASLILLSLTIYFAPRIIQLIKQAAS